jgi:uncharacterized repeat protein (TIGR03803 family)
LQSVQFKSEQVFHFLFGELLEPPRRFFTILQCTVPPQPFGSLTISGSTLYGMSDFGGATPQGAIYSLPGAGGTPTILYSFDNTHGQNPEGDLLLVGSTFYGMTAIGGAHADGVIFSEPVTGGTPTILFSFDGAAHGSGPNGDLTLVGSTLYGMTLQGGANNDGVVFGIPMSGGTPTVLHTFGGADGANPNGSLTLAGLTLYGMTKNGGANNDGTVFAIVLPEPSGAVLLGLGALALGVLTLRRNLSQRAVSKLVVYASSRNDGDHHA